MRSLDALARLSSPVGATWVDSGSEFMADFEEACHTRAMTQFVLPPYSRRLNGRAERLHRTCREECDDLTSKVAPATWLDTLRAQLLTFVVTTEHSDEDREE